MGYWQQCPNVLNRVAGKLMICQDNLSVEAGLDLNVEPQTSSPLRGCPARGGDASRQARICAGHGTPAAVDVSALRGALRRRAQGQELLVSGPVLRDGVRAADLSRVAARHRGVSVLHAESGIKPAFCNKLRLIGSSGLSVGGFRPS